MEVKQKKNAYESKSVQLLTGPTVHTVHNILIAYLCKQTNKYCKENKASVIGFSQEFSF